MLLSLVIMYMDHRQHHLEAIRSGLSILIYPLQYVVNLPSRIGHWADTGLSSRDTLIKENLALKEQLLEQKIRLLKFAALESENVRLRELLQSANRGWDRVQIAELLSVDFDPFRRQILLNKGSDDGVFEGHPLLDAHGVMGQVINVNRLTSTAMLITDPSHAIPVQVNRNGLRAIALGTGSADQLDIPHIPINADIEVGDLLISSGLGARFPSGYPVAEVSSIDRDPRAPFARIIARPLAHLEQAREVLLVWPQEEQGDAVPSSSTEQPAAAQPAAAKPAATQPAAAQPAAAKPAAAQPPAAKPAAAQPAAAKPAAAQPAAAQPTATQPAAARAEPAQAAPARPAVTPPPASTTAPEVETP